MSAETNESEIEVASSSQPKWKPLTAIQRRVAGVLIEKAKTTPDAYPLSLNAVTTGCNQKSNRDPQMSLDADDVEEALEQLRELGAVGEVQGGGRVAKYRHYMKEWLGVGGTELAVMAELLLRGAQSVGDLRARAARMASGQLMNLAALHPVLLGLTELGLVQPVTPEGRGQIVTHALYMPAELERVQREHAGHAVVGSSHTESDSSGHGGASERARPTTSSSVESTQASSSVIAQLRDELSQVRSQLRQLQEDLEVVKSKLS